MGKPSGPPPQILSPPPPLPSLPSLAVIQAGANDAGCQVRCTGCKMILTVGAGLTEFVCPKCKLPQMLPPELLPTPQQQQRTTAAHGVVPTEIQLPCAHCKAILNVPHGLSRFDCPQCGVDLAVDLSKMRQFLPPSLTGAPPFPMPPFPEKVNERPPKLSIGPPHPDPVVETSSLSAVKPPEPTYNLSIRDELEISKALSCSQMETLVYACQRHHQHLSSGARAGFFIGDGDGVGKGRTIAGLIWESWHHKRRKALWISVGSDLKFDARRDLNNVGASRIKVHVLNKLPYSKLDSKSVGISEGVIFLTYSSLLASSVKGLTRLQQLVQWCGPEYDGLIIFDEARLLQARVIYCSATSASEPCNMGFMVRLGLWGAGTSFLSFRDFLGAMEKGGVGALELVAMDMKARGMSVCRTLSYKGADFEVVEVPLKAKKMVNLTKNAAHKEARVRDLETRLVRSRASRTPICQVKVTKNAADKEAWVRDMETQSVRSQASRTPTCQVNLTKNAAYKEAQVRDLEKIKRKGKEILERHNSRGNDVLKIKADDYIGLRNDLLELGAEIYATREIVEKRLNESSSSLKWNKDRVRELESKLASLEQELLSGKDVAATVERQFSSEISRLTELVELYKESSEEWSKKARELEGMVTALETHLVQVEDDYKQRLENEALAKKEIEKEANRWKEKFEKCAAELESFNINDELKLLSLGSFTSESGVDQLEATNTVEEDQVLLHSIPVGDSGTVTAASLLRYGWSLAQLYTKYQEAVDELLHEGRKQSRAILEQEKYEKEFQKHTDEAGSKVNAPLARAEEQAHMIESLYPSVAMYRRYEEVHEPRSPHAPHQEAGPAPEEAGKKGKSALPRKKVMWSEEEMQALSAGIEKYGTGLWRQILNDAEFASVLKNRTNVDLKDKWRNMTKRTIDDVSADANFSADPIVS